MKRKRKIQIILALTALLIIGGTMLVNSPRVQLRVSVILATELENHIGTRVSLGGVRWLFPTDIIIDSLSIDDQEGEQLITLPHMAAKMEWKPLLKSWMKGEKLQLSVRNIRIFHPDINLYRESPEAAFNYQFLIDAFTTKKEKNEPSRLDLRINTLLIRHANLKVENVNIKDFSTHISLKTLTTDSLSLTVRNLDFTEQSGLQVNDLHFRLVGNKQGATLAEFGLDLPNSTLRLDTLWTAWDPFLIKGKTLPSYITPSDLASLIPEVKDLNERIYLHTDFTGSHSRLNIKEADLYTQGADMAFNVDGTIDLSNKQHPEANFNLNKATITAKAWELIKEQLPPLYSLIPKEVIRIGGIAAKGTIQIGEAQNTATLQAKTDAGTLKTAISIDGKKRYTAHLNGTGINIAQIIPTSPLTQTDLTLSAKGEGLCGEFQGTASNTQLMGYDYKSIELKGNYANNIYKAEIDIDDPNGALALTAEYVDSGRVPHYYLDLKADSLNLHALHLINIHEGKSFSAHLSADLRGNDIEHMVGKANIEKFIMHREGEDYMMSNMFVNSVDPYKKFLTLGSEFLDVEVRGDFTYRTLLSSLKAHLHEFTPSLSDGHTHSMSNNLCYAHITVRNTRPIEELLLIPLSIGQLAEIDAWLCDDKKEIELTIDIPQLTYNGDSFTNIGFTCLTDTLKATINAYGTAHTHKGIHIHAGLDATAKDDRITLGTTWSSNPDNKRFAGVFNTSAFLSRNSDDALEIAVKSDSSYATINYEEWKLTPFDLYIAPQRTTVNNFHFEHDEKQYLNIEGGIAETLEDTLSVKLNNIDLNYLLSLVKLEGISFGGRLNGTVNAAALYSPKPYIDARINAQDFSFCKGILGDTDIQAQWNADSTRLEFVADINETLQDTTHIDGIYDAGKNELWLDIDAHNTNLSFLNDLTKSFIDNVDGHANGHLLLGGKLDSLDFHRGSLLADATLRLVPTNTRYAISDSIRFSPGKIIFDNITVFDHRKNQALLNGVVNHERIATFDYSLNIEAQNILGIDIQSETGEESFYTTIYGTGDIHVNGGPGKPLKVDIIDAKTGRESVFALNLAGQNATASETFLTFRDRSSKRNTPTQTTRTRRRRHTQEAEGPLQLNIIANITPDAKFKLVMDPTTDDHISASGSGELRIVTNDDQLSLYGQYTINHGEYRLNLQDLITKNFTVQAGSSVNFNGDPMNAQLDITARYIAPLAQLKDLSPEYTGSVQANCLLHIGGTLNAPALTFDIELPRSTEEQKSILRSYTSTEEQRNLQFIYLLATGRFYTQDMSQTNQGARIESFLSNTISGQINNFISNFIDNDNWNFSGNIHTENLMGEASTETWDNMEIEGMLEGRLLNNRLLINGNFGYRNNPIYATNFIGDFDLRYLLTNNLSIKGYSKTNDRYFTKTALYTQGLGLLYQREFNSFWKPKKKK